MNEKGIRIVLESRKNIIRSAMLDRMDRKILDILQKDCTLPVAEIGKQIGLSTTPCWRRIQKLEELGVIQRRVRCARPQEGQCRGDGVRLHHHQPSHPRLARALPCGAEGFPRSGRVLPHERAGRLSAARGGAGHRALRRFLQEADQQDRAVRRELGLRHGADQVHHGAAARLRHGRAPDSLS